MASAIPQIQVLVDWTNNPLGPGAIAGNNFVDISQYVRLVDGVNITHGRQDSISTVQAGKLTFTVDNSTGRFTPNKSTSPYYPGVILGRRIRVNVKDEAGTYHTRFDGMIAQIDIDPAITGQEAKAMFTCADILAHLNRQPPLSCWTVEACASSAIAGATPVLQYVMNEPANSTGIHDSSGNDGPTLAPWTYVAPPYTTVNTGGSAAYLTAPTVTYGSGNNPVEGAVPPTFAPGNTLVNTSPVTSPLTSVAFGATLNTSGKTVAATFGPSAQFQGDLPNPLTVKAGNSFTLLGWVWPNIPVTSSTFMVYYLKALCLSNTRTGAMLALECNNSGGGGSGSLVYLATWYSNYLKFASTNSAFSTGVSSSSYNLNGPVMVALVVNGTTATCYVGGNIIYNGDILLNGGTVTIPSGTTFNFLSIGGPIGGGNGWIGNISNVCLYNTALSTANLTTLASIGATGCQGLPAGGSGNPFSWLAYNFPQLPSYWTGTAGSSIEVLDYVDITGSNPTSAMQSIAAPDKGLYFVDAAGKLQYQSAAARMGAGAPSVTLPAGSYDVSIKPKWTDQYLVNYAAYQNERGGMGVAAQNNTSIAQYGEYPNGSVTSPQTAPYSTWVRNYYMEQVSNPYTTTTQPIYNNQNIIDAASWDVNTLGQPGMRLASLNVDTLKNQPGHNEYVAPSALYGLEINSVLGVGQSLAWWPDGPEVSELFIEGVTESYSTTAADVSFYVSPAFQGRAWQVGSAAYGQLDQTARVGVSVVNTDSGVAVEDQTSLFGPANYTGSYVDARQQRSISSNLQIVNTPPLLFIQQAINTQSLTNNTWQNILFDTTVLDTVQAMNRYTDGAQSCVILQAGWYEIYTTVNFAANDTGPRAVRIIQNQNGPLRQLAPISQRGTGAVACGMTTGVIVYCQVGDAIAVQANQGSGAALSTSLANGGSHLSYRYLGNGSARN